MRYAPLAAVLLALSASLASAGTKLWTRYGVLGVVRGEVDETLDLAGRPVFGPEGIATDHRLELTRSWKIGAEDVILVGGWAGGNDICSNSHFFVTVSAAGARATAPFGRCIGTPIAARVAGSRLEIDLRSSDPRDDHIAVVFENGNVSEAAVPMREVPAPMPGGGEAVTRWTGSYPRALLEDPGERQRFLAIMPRDKLFDLMDRVAVSTGNHIEDGWLFATGCMAHQCGFEMGGYAIEIASGRAEALLFHKQGAPEAFGGTLDNLHPALRALARTGRLE